MAARSAPGAIAATRPTTAVAAAIAAMLTLPTRLAITTRAIALWPITAGAIAVTMRGAHGIAVGGDAGRSVALMARAV